MANIVVINRPGQLHLDRNDPPVPALDDEVDLSIAAVESQMADPSPGCLRVDPDTLRHKRLKERAKEWGVPNMNCADLSSAEEPVHVDAEELSGKRRIGQLVLGSCAKPTEVVPGWQPRRNGIHNVESQGCLDTVSSPTGTVFP